MKRHNNLFDSIISLDNLYLADEKARQGKLNTYGVRVHDRNREANLYRLHQQLKNGTYRTSPYHIFTIHEPKEREIYRLPYYPDRIVHHAIMNILEPIWVRTFTADTCSCIKGRGIMAAHDKMLRYLKDIPGTRYCLKVDIRKFYPSVNHDILKRIIRRKIKDKRLLALLDEIIDSAPGIPIGNYLSQYFANLMLTYIDHYIKEQLHVRYYIRYADDMVFLAATKEELANVLAELKRLLADIKLTLKGNEQIFPIADNRTDRHARPVDFVGYCFYHNQTLLRKSIKQAFCRKCAHINRLHLTPRTYTVSIAAWLGWIKYSNSHHLLQKVSSTQFYRHEKSKLFRKASRI